MTIVILGLSVTSSWGNGHATTYRGLMRGLAERGHDVLFLERDVPWYADNRDLRQPPYGRTELYDSFEELKDRFAREIVRADLVIVGSYVPQGVPIGEWVLNTARGTTAFYDIDTPVTLGKLERGDYEYISPELAGRYQIYLSFTGGPTLERIARLYGAQRPRALYCSVDPDVYHPQECTTVWDLGYLGTYSNDRQPALDRMLTETARRFPKRKFVVAGPQYPDTIQWPENVERIEHLAPADHCRFYNSQRFTLNVTRKEMVAAGWSPSVRLFEAAACGVPIVSDYWPGLEDFFVPGKEIILNDAAGSLKRMGSTERRALGLRAREVVLKQHTAVCRAAELENYVTEARGHDHISIDSARRNGHGRQDTRGTHGGSLVESNGTAAGGGTAAQATAHDTGGDLYQSAGAGEADGATTRERQGSGAASLASVGGTQLRRVDGAELP